MIMIIVFAGICYLYSIDVQEGILQRDMNFFRYCARCFPLSVGVFASIFLGNEYDENTIQQRFMLVETKYFYRIKFVICILFGVILCLAAGIGQSCIKGRLEGKAVIMLVAMLLWCIIDVVVVMVGVIFLKGSVGGIVITLVLFFYNQSIFFKYSVGNLYMYLAEALLL